ncbi:MAG: cytochrome b [Magnetococcales bacterium]|nr:cytochrome b [Magnetococcales bacterium]
MNPTATDPYDPVARWIHWGMALMLFALVGLGFYATSLTYYDPLYHRSVFWHRSLGLLVFALAVIRLGWRWRHPPPPLPADTPNWEHQAALWTHRLLYALMFLLPITGYLISTADGRGVTLFGWFEVPALLEPDKERATRVGQLHLGAAILFSGLVAMHVAAALKHHFINRDGILRRMWP